QLEPQAAALARRAALGEARRAPGRGRERGVAAPALAAARDDGLLADRDEVGDDLAGVPVRRARSDGHLDHEVGARPARALAALALLARLGLEGRAADELVERGDVVDGPQYHRPAVAAVAAVGAARGDVLEPEERQPAVAAPAGLHRDVEYVPEGQARTSPNERRGPLARTAPLAADTVAGRDSPRRVSRRPSPACRRGRTGPWRPGRRTERCSRAGRTA